MSTYKVEARVRGGMGQPSYSGTVTVQARDDKQAEERARKRLRKTYWDYRPEDLVILKVSRE